MRARRSPKKSSGKLKPITFVPVRKVFKPMVEIRLLMDISGWADKDKRVKWHMAAGSTEIIDEDKAREFVTKGYAKYTSAPKKPISEDERAEALATVTRLTPGGENG